MKLYMVNTEEEFALLEMYCAGKSALWNLFFGWRKTVTVNNENRYYYKIPKSAFERCESLAQEHLGFEII